MLAYRHGNRRSGLYDRAPLVSRAKTRHGAGSAKTLLRQAVNVWGKKLRLGCLLVRLQTVGDRQSCHPHLAMVGEVVAGHLVASFGKGDSGFRRFRLRG